MCPRPKSNKQVPLVQPNEELVPADKLKKISPGMIRVVDAFAKEVPIHEVAENENITVHGINNRLKAVRKLLDVYSTSGAYRKLLLIGKIVLS